MHVVIAKWKDGDTTVHHEETMYGLFWSLDSFGELEFIEKLELLEERGSFLIVGGEIEICGDADDPLEEFNFNEITKIIDNTYILQNYSIREVLLLANDPEALKVEIESLKKEGLVE